MLSGRDFYLRLVLTIIAICLVILVIKSGVSLYTSEAEAVIKKTKLPPVAVYELGKIPAPELKEVIILGDQHTFLLRAKDNVTVYRVDYIRD